MSLLLHRVGNSILVDELDLTGVLCHKDLQSYKDWDELAELVRHCIPKEEVSLEIRLVRFTKLGSATLPIASRGKV